jgi:uncharacterized phage-associated protein
MTTFIFRPEKFASAVAYLVQLRPGLTKKQLCKLLFLADKQHLLRYGRTITGDRYFALEQGPIPTEGLKALNGKGRFASALQRYGRLEGWVFKLEQPPDLKALSRSDVATLDDIAKRFGDYPAWRLEEITHQEPAWQRAPQNGEMDFELFFEGHPEADTIKAILSEEELPV